MADQLGLFAEPQQFAWAPPKGQGACRRDPAAGPGTCWHWWDGCPKAKQRGCHLLWLRERASQAERAPTSPLEGEDSKARLTPLREPLAPRRNRLAVSSGGEG